MRKTPRVPGLVRAMREVRAKLAAGLSAQEADILAARIRHLLAETENLCRRQGQTPRDLPRPSRTAYSYLAGLDFERLPVRSGSGEGRPTQLRVTRLIRHRDSFQRRLAAVARKIQEERLSQVELAAEVARLREQALDIAGEVSVLCERAGVAPASLPDPSRRAYQWFSFLGEGERLLKHVNSLAQAMSVDPRPIVEFYHLADLYRVWRNGETIRLAASQGFAGAPEDVIRALVKMALPYTHKRQHRETINHYVESQAFQQTVLGVELSGGAHEGRTRGQWFDLEEIYRRVNEEYFGGRMARPRLTWSQCVTLGEFGHYQSSSDVLVLSMALDSPDVPGHVVEFVMFHELLHKELGADLVRGRRMVHTRAFRQMERRFRRYAEAEAFLTRYSRRLASGGRAS